jgi:hypothetical protein
LKRIRTRDLYKCVDYKVVDWLHRDTFHENVTPERIVAEAKKAAEVLLKKSIDQAIMGQGLEKANDGDSFSIADYQSLTSNDVVVDFATMHYGMKEKNPLDFIEFYSKHHPNGN